MASEKDLLAMLKGLPEQAVEKIVKIAGDMAVKEKARAEAQEKLDVAKTAILEALQPAIAELKVDFDVKVRNGAADIHLVGAGKGGGGTPSSGTFRSTGHTMRWFVEEYGTPEEAAEYEDADPSTGSGRGKQYNLAMKARTRWVEAGSP